MPNYTYVGNELTLFAQATRYKSYLASRLKPFIAGDVLEVGSGIGANIAYLIHAGVRSWTALEPDKALLDAVPPLVQGLAVQKTSGTIAEVENVFDTVLYSDVLEHIAEDRRELELAASRIRKAGGRLLVVCPAHAHLFSTFDAQVGHFRRYSKSTLTSLAPPGFAVRKCFYIDSIGYFLSLANRYLLRQANPTQGQILFWDRVVIPLSRISDRLLCNAFGKTVIAIFERDAR